MGVHFWRIRKDGGLSRPVKYAADKGTEINGLPGRCLCGPSWDPLLVLVVAVILFAALLADAPLLEQANPAFPENPAKSPWYFLGIQELVSYSAFAGGLLVPCALPGLSFFHSLQGQGGPIRRRLVFRKGQDAGWSVVQQVCLCLL